MAYEWFLSPCSAAMDTNLLSNIHKLFSERIDIFSLVEFNKVGREGSQSSGSLGPRVGVFNR